MIAKSLSMIVIQANDSTYYSIAAVRPSTLTAWLHTFASLKMFYH